VQAHGIARFLVQDHGEEVEGHHLLEPWGQVMEQRAQTAV
jgi:hypothetical protein